MKIVIGLPNASGMVTNEWAINLAILCGVLIKHKYDIMPVAVDRSLIDNARNTVLKVAQENDADYVFFLDSDTCIQPNGILKLLKLDKDIASPPVADRKGGSHLNILRDDLSKYHELNKTQKVSSIGMACTLIKRKVIDDMLSEYMKPFEFQTAEYNGGKVEIGEDIGFCLRARDKFGYETWAVKGIKTWHEGETKKYYYEG